jgi:hypothetical protein
VCQGEYLEVPESVKHEAIEICIMGFIFVLYTKYFWNDLFKKYEISGHVARLGQLKNATKFCTQNQNIINHLHNK